MYLLDLLSRGSSPERRWFILFQDYLLYALLFVTGPVGLFVNMWTGHTLTCIPVINCALEPNASLHCLTNKTVWQKLTLPLTTHLSDMCMENHTLPFYILYAYVPAFIGAVVAWLLHNLWLKVPPYARIARLYGHLDRDQRNRVINYVCYEIDRRQQGLPQGARPYNRSLIMEEEYLVNATTGTKDLVKSFIALLNRKDAPKLHRFFQYSNLISMLLLGIGGGIVISHVWLFLNAPFPCEIGEEHFLSVNYTSISCSLHNEMRARTLYMICAILALLIAAMKFFIVLHVFCKICCGRAIKASCSWDTCNMCMGACFGASYGGKECAQYIGTDIRALRLLLAEKTDVPSETNNDRREAHMDRYMLEIETDKITDSDDRRLIRHFQVFVTDTVAENFNRHYKTPVPVVADEEALAPVMKTAAFLKIKG